MSDRPRVAITYCTGCKWLPRAAWMAQEILGSLADEVGEVALIPASGGVFTIAVGDQVVFDRSEGGFIEPKLIKRRVRDAIAPGKSLGHVDQ